MHLELEEKKLPALCETIHGLHFALLLKGG